MPTDLGLKAMNAVHRGMLKVTGGRFGWELSRMPVLELTTTGRKSGQPRRTPVGKALIDNTLWIVFGDHGEAFGERHTGHHERSGRGHVLDGLAGDGGDIAVGEKFGEPRGLWRRDQRDAVGRRR